MIEIEVPAAENLSVTEDTLAVDLSDGRTISVPLAWYPRLHHASPAELNNWRLIGKGHGIHWEDLDEDISVEGLLAGKTLWRKPDLLPKLACQSHESTRPRGRTRATR